MLVRMVWLCLPKVRPTKSMPMNEWQCDCRRTVLGAMRAAQAWDSGEEPSSAEVRAFKMLLAGVLPRCAKVESETDERRRRAVATRTRFQLLHTRRQQRLCALPPTRGLRARHRCYQLLRRPSRYSAAGAVLGIPTRKTHTVARARAMHAIDYYSCIVSRTLLSTDI